MWDPVQQKKFGDQMCALILCKQESEDELEEEDSEDEEEAKDSKKTIIPAIQLANLAKEKV
jgi:hypothetical protein